MHDANVSLTVALLLSVAVVQAPPVFDFLMSAFDAQVQAAVAIQVSAVRRFFHVCDCMFVIELHAGISVSSVSRITTRGHHT